MTTIEKTPNYSTAQEQIIRDYAASNGVLNIDHAKALAAMPALNATDGTPRKAASIVAKIARLGLDYQRKMPVTKTGETPVKKTELVAQIAGLVSVSVAALDGMEKSPKGALQSLLDALGERVETESETVNG